MNAFELLLRGAAAGVAISAPVGPVNVLCVARTISKGWGSGIVSGLGAAAADTVYGSVAGFSISIVIGFLLREQDRLRLWGGILLMLLGIWYFFKHPDSLTKKNDGPDHSDFVTTFLLNLTNPTTVLSFLAVLAVLGLSEHRAAWLTLVMVGGIFVGSMAWWLLLTGVANRYRDKFDDHAILWMNRIGGMAIGAFGIIMFILGAGKVK